MGTTKTVQRTNQDGDIKNSSKLLKGNSYEDHEYHAYTTAELDAADVVLTGIKVPSNAVISEILMYNDDLDSNGSPLLAFDIGVYAADDYTSTTSAVDTIHLKDSVVDADLFVDGDTTAQAATTKYTSLAFDSATCGPDDIYKSIYELLGYDNDPSTEFGIVITTSAAAATAVAGDVALLVRYSAD